MNIDPSVWENRAMRRALAERDITEVYRRLVAAGLNQRQIGDLTGQRPMPLLLGRRVGLGGCRTILWVTVWTAGVPVGRRS
jgi:hypothetical protein